jgi:hypothetical protein
VTSSAEVAIRGAIDDAARSAGALGLYTRTPLGEPRVLEGTNDPAFGHLFSAEADAFRTP